MQMNVSSFAASIPRISGFILAGALLHGCASMSQDAGPDARAIVASEVRTEGDRGLDASRHPAEFLQFIQVKPGMRALDVIAGGGYTTQLLALAVGPSGKVWAQGRQISEGLTKRLADRPQANIVLAPRSLEDPVPPEAAPLDLITLVNNYHDIACAPIDRSKMLKALFAGLKPGGHFVVVDHSTAPGAGITACKTLHRIEDRVVLSEATAAGFVLEEEGRFLRNPADPRDQPSGRPAVPTDKFAYRFVRPR